MIWTSPSKKTFTNAKIVEKNLLVTKGVFLKFDFAIIDFYLY